MTNAPTPSAAGLVGTPVKSGRLMSLDALRGFDMFWIVGADALSEGVRHLGNNGFIGAMATQLRHSKWEGFHFEDLIFPMFVFIAGVSLVFSLSRMIEQEGRFATVKRIVRRSVLLYLLGIFFYGGFSTPFEGIRLMGVLQRIALAYLFAGLIFCFFKPRERAIWCIGLLVGYWALMTFVPVPGGTAGNFTEGQNLADWMDKQYLPLLKLNGDHDPEGILSTLPAIANCLLGVFAGMLLHDAKRSDLKKVCILAATGLAMLALGWLWNIQFPVIKKIWTSSFVLVACGYSCLLLAAFHYIIEVRSWRGWAQPFVWVGMNPITIYLIYNLVSIGNISQRFVGGDLSKLFLGKYGPLTTAIVGIIITFGICRFLYQRKIFLRL